MNFPGLDYAFLKYLNVSIAGEAALHAFYLPLLAQYPRVLDLGCGLGGFVKLLCDNGHDAYGVDSDAQCIAAARRHSLSVVGADVVEHLRGLQPASLDAIFSAHMVEHMPYAVVLETIQLAHRALKPGGRLLLVTPNPQALITHLELFHMHFGHVALYHPALLSFFMDYCGFAATATGENPDTLPEMISATSPLRVLSQLPPIAAPLAKSGPILPRPTHPLRRALWYVKMMWVRWLVQPYFDQTRRELAATQGQLVQLAQNLETTLAAINRPFECYALGDKAGAETTREQMTHDV